MRTKIYIMVLFVIISYISFVYILYSFVTNVQASKTGLDIWKTVIIHFTYYTLWHFFKTWLKIKMDKTIKELEKTMEEI